VPVWIGGEAAARTALHSWRLGAARLVAGSGIVAASNGPSGPAVDKGTSRTQLVDNGGPVLRQARIQLIFWGSAWSAATSPSVTDIKGAFAGILASPYTSELAQYRQASVKEIAGDITVTASEPPNPCSTGVVADLIFSLLDAGGLAGPETDPFLLHCVILPTGVTAGNPNVAGEHGAFAYYDVPADELPSGVRIPYVRFAWLTNGASVDALTTAFSHALVESCTDPDGNAFQAAPGTCAGPNWCEIGDVCAATGLSDGVRVHAYWSQRASACVIPGGHTSSMATGPVALAQVADSTVATAPSPTHAVAPAAERTPASEARAMAPAAKEPPAYLFWTEVVYLILLLASAALYINWGSFRSLLPDPIGPVPLGVAWFGALGAVTISLYGIVRYSRTWDPSYTYAHLAGPLTGAVTGVVGFLIFEAVVNATGVQVSNRPIAYVIAFLLGYRQESFRELIKKATDLLILPGLKTNGPAGPSQPNTGASG
jgi:hypothetical protein